ncbi:ABC transporter substrate-binding protein [Proteocatella sphenisci]|uniref:ABC transporter substrate-binding protein n=1 Tax=Proteocatella sphenisci TaxID=181070 RepID=UPI00048EB1D6|nr:spermidine/putrescine ABC transporter substrate-binding protein [Proteocatella sphenisci]
MKKIFTSIMLIFTLGLSLTACGGSGSKEVLNVYNWGDYIDKSVIREFEDEFNVKVNYEEYATNEEMLAKIEAGGTAYDVIFPSEYMVEYMLSKDLLNELDYTNLDNFKNIDERFTNLPYDSNSKHSVPYLWGTMGIVYNKNMVTEPVNSWEILWDEKYAGKILMLDSSRDTIGVTLKMLGYSLNTKNIDELNEAKATLIEQKPLVRAYEVDTYKDQMIAEEAAMALCWSGDAMLLMDENENLAYSIPQEGTNLWFDTMAVPKTSQNKELAEKFINFMMRPEIAAKNSDYIKYSSPNMEALNFLPEKDTSNPYLYPTGDINNIGEVFLDLGEFTTEYDKAWTEIKSS